MGWWTERVVPRLTDLALRSEEIAGLRAEVCAGLRGEVLEVGFGSGLNLPHYPAEVTAIAAVEPADVGWELSAPRRARTAVAVSRVGLDGQQLPLPEASVDSALITFSLCTIPDAAEALQEVRRVLRPGGGLHFLEHGLSPEPGVARWQRRLEPLQSRAFGGCHLTRDVPLLLEEAGFAVTALRSEYLPGPRVGRPWTYGYLGTAER